MKMRHPADLLVCVFCRFIRSAGRSPTIPALQFARPSPSVPSDLFKTTDVLWRYRRSRLSGVSHANGFTLLEVLLAVALLGITSTLTFMVFTAATTAWQRGTTMVDRLHHGDYVMNQLVVALRSAYWKDDNGRGQYGFVHESRGSDESSSDEISWVKLGGALVGRNQDFVETPHRVRFFLSDSPEGAAFTAWRLAGQPDDFDPDSLEPVILSEKVRGFRCRTAYMLDPNDEIDWLDEWELTNKVPILVEVTLYMEPIEENDPPLEMRRIVGIQTAQDAFMENQ